MVALDGFHNNESKMPDHYQWEGTSDGSFSKLGNGFRAHDVEVRTIRSRIDAKALEGVALLIIVDPDTPDETSDPKYIEDAEIDAIDEVGDATAGDSCCSATTRDTPSSRTSTSWRRASASSSSRRLFRR